MATGVKPRDEDTRLTREDFENIQDAMKNKKFRDLLAEYCEEIRDPANQQLYQKEMTQLEKERGYDVTFINPKGGYVIKTSVAGDRKAFINICSSDNIEKPSYKVEIVDGKRGMNWQVPYSIIPPRDDFDHNKQRCVIYDVVFHPDTLRMAAVNKQFRELVNKTAFEGLKQTYNIHLDNNNFRFTKTQYRGMSIPAVIRKEDPNYQPLDEEETEHLSQEMLDKFYPQHIYSDTKTNCETIAESAKPTTKVKNSEQFSHLAQDGYTIPKYIIKQQKSVDLQEYTYNKDCKQFTAFPSHIVIEVYLPLLSSTKDCILDVEEKSLSLISEKPAKYKLAITLPYPVNDECGSAKFDKSKHMLIVTLPVIKKNNNGNKNFLKVDSGVESEENSSSQSDDDSTHSNLVVELSSTPADTVAKPEPCNVISNNMETFLDPSLAYILPPYTHNVLDDIVAFTFHVKNTEPDSVIVKSNENKIYIKFTTVGAGFVPVHYAAIITFDSDVKFDNVTGEAWDNNVIMQLELAGNVPQNFNIGLGKESMTCQYFDVSHVKKAKPSEKLEEGECETAAPVVEVTNLGNETNIVVSSNQEEYDEDDFQSPTSTEKEIVVVGSGICENGAKSILRKPDMMRSFSESSAGDVASSMDYISSDCIPEESSLKKTVRFNSVIAKQFYRYNSSIEGQKKKNQRKKSKKRSDRRKSESEAEDDAVNTSQNLKSKLKSVLKQRRDSGLADTSDAETESKSSSYEQSYNNTIEDKYRKNCKESSYEKKSVFNIVDNKDHYTDQSDTEIWETSKHKKQNDESLNCDIKHNTSLYDPDKLNKGQYSEVMFKNDLIFDLDM